MGQTWIATSQIPSRGLSSIPFGSVNHISESLMNRNAERPQCRLETSSHRHPLSLAKADWTRLNANGAWQAA